MQALHDAIDQAMISQQPDGPAAASHSQLCTCGTPSSGICLSGLEDISWARNRSDSVDEWVDWMVNL